MDYEKEYKSLVAKVKKAHLFAQTDSTKKVLEDILPPQLRESEDERIRRELIEYLRGDLDDITTDDTDRWINWIEKQKELPFVKDVMLGYPGLYFYDGERMHFRGPAMEEKQKEPKELPLMDGNADLYFDEWNQQKQNPTKRQCFEEGMRYAQRLQKEQKPVEWSEEDKLMQTVVIQTLERFGGRGTTRMQIDWLKSLRPQPKQERTESDDYMIQSIYETLYSYKCDISTGKLGKIDRDFICAIEKQIAFIKERIPHITTSSVLLGNDPHWKPSSEQMIAFEETLLPLAYTENRFILSSMFKQLKKLM